MSIHAKTEYAKIAFISKKDMTQNRQAHEHLVQQMLKLLQARRTSAKVSQVELARRLDWTQADISKCETGVRRLDVVELKLWLEALDSNLAGFVEELYGSTCEG